jgi:hypothetical protein
MGQSVRPMLSVGYADRSSVVIDAASNAVVGEELADGLFGDAEQIGSGRSVRLISRSAQSSANPGFFRDATLDGVAEHVPATRLQHELRLCWSP